MKIPSNNPQKIPLRAHYMLRYHAPLDDFDRHLDRLLKICRDAEIGEVMFFIEPEERCQGFPPFDRLRRWADALRRGGEILRRHGIEMSINVWLTLGHGDGRSAPPKELGLVPMVGDDGAVSVDCACPADPAWKHYIDGKYAILAAANPHIIWADDDFRLHGHWPVSFGCFAPPMLAAFAKRSGRRWTRAKLVRAILANTGPVRAQWMRFTGDLWIENARLIRRAIDRVNPSVKFGLMTSTMAAHSIEGRRWPELLKAAAGRHRPITRPSVGYGEVNGHDLAFFFVFLRLGLAYAGRATRCCAELENYSFSRFGRSYRQTALHMELMQFFGSRDITLDVFQHSGNDPANEPWVVDYLRRPRPRLDALAAMRMERRVEQGVHLWTHPRAAQYQQLDRKATGLMALWPNFTAWGNVCARFGVAAAFETRGNLTLVGGDAIRAANRREILRLLRGGVFLDGRAAFALQAMGYGRHLGIKIRKRLLVGRCISASLEVVLDDEFGLPGSRYLTSLQLGKGPGGQHCIYLNQLCGARAVSEIQSSSLRPVTPCLTLFENSLGGRVAFTAYDFDSGVADADYGKLPKFYNHVRKRQFLAALRWLNRNRPILAALDPAPLMVAACTAGRARLLTICNISGDALDAVRIEMPRPPYGQVELLDDAGRWKNVGSRVRRLARNEWAIGFEQPLQPFQNAFLRW